MTVPTVPLRSVADVRVSNVDKKSDASEKAVRLCNYTDVYYNETITDGLPLMTATATRQQIVNFGLTSGDSIITKDSETVDDIGVPSFVPMDLPGVVCGYHLALIRPQPTIDPRFLSWALHSSFVSDQLAVRASGVTRFGLTYGAIKGARIPLPPLAEQRRISDFLDDQVTRIDRAIQLRKRQVMLLSRRRNHPLIDAASDLGDQVPSPIDWFPSWQSDWRLLRLSWIAKCFDGRRIPLSAEEREGRAGPYPYFGASTVVDHIDDYLFDGDYVLVGEDGASLENGDFDVVQQVRGRFWVNNHAHVLQGTEVENAYLAEFLRCVDRPILISGATRPKITQEDLMSISVAVPGPDVRRALTAACIEQREASARLEGRIRHSVELLQERKRSLITAAVTGEFDVSSASVRASGVAMGGVVDQ